MTKNASEVPGREQVLAVVWKLLQLASDDAAAPDHAACAKYAELLLKRGGEKAAHTLSPELMAEILSPTEKAASTS